MAVAVSVGGQHTCALLVRLPSDALQWGTAERGNWTPHPGSHLMPNLSHRNILTAARLETPAARI